VLFRLAIKEILNHRRFFILFIMNAALGLMGLAAVEGFRASVQTVLSARAQTILGADLEIGGRSQPDPMLLQKVEDSLPDFEVAESQGLYSMLRRGEGSRLVHVRVVPANFPFYGEMVFEEGSSTIHESDNRVWIYQELKAQMGIEPGDRVGLGSAEFIVSGVVTEDPQQGLAGATLAPRIFISPSGVKQAGLITKGSLVSYSRFYKFFEPFVISDTQVRNISAVLDDPAIRVTTPEEASERLGARLGYIGDFLGLVSLVALFLASVGMFYLYRSYLFRRSRDMAIYRSLGLPGKEVIKVYLYQLLILSTIATVLGGLFGYLLLQAASWLLISHLLFPLQIGFSMRLALLLFMAGIVGTLLLALPLLRHITAIKPAFLIQGFRESGPDADSKTSSFFSVILSAAPWCIFFAVLSVVVSHSYIIGGMFFGIFLGLPILLFPICLLLLRVAVKYSKNLPFSLRMAVLYAGRFRLATTATFIAIMFSAVLLNLVPIIQAGLIDELRTPAGRESPSFFMFDIQEEETEQVRAALERQGIALTDLSPMIRGRLNKVNGLEFDRMEGREALTREEEHEMRFRNRGLNLSYRVALSESETVVRGQYFSEPFKQGQDAIGQVSVEQRYASRLGIKMGDLLELEVFGMPVEVEVTSLRRVRWTGFSPNFFMVLQPGIIDDAPAVYLAATGYVPEDKRISFQTEMLNEFPSISIIDLNRLLERLLSISSQIASALQAMTLLTFIVGVMVLFSIVSHQMEMKKRDVVLLKTLGLSFSRLRSIFRLETLTISLLAASTGSLAGIILSRIVSYFFFDTVWSFNILIPILVITGTMLVTYLVSELSIKKVLSTPSKAILQEGAAGY